jgi:hypothetical protein
MPGPRFDATIRTTSDTKGVAMEVWAWVLLAVGVIGLIGAVLICAAVWECTTMRFRRWDALP